MNRYIVNSIDGGTIDATGKLSPRRGGPGPTYWIADTLDLYRPVYEYYPGEYIPWLNAPNDGSRAARMRVICERLNAEHDAWVAAQAALDAELADTRQADYQRRHRDRA